MLSGNGKLRCNVRGRKIILIIFNDLLTVPVVHGGISRTVKDVDTISGHV